MSEVNNSGIENVIIEQQQLAEQIRELQAREKELRADVLSKLFGANVIGTVKSQVCNMIVTGTFGLTYSVDSAAVEEALELSELPEECFDAFRVKYELDKKYYDQLSDAERKVVDKFLTVKPSLPTLKIKVLPVDEE